MNEPHSGQSAELAALQSDVKAIFKRIDEQLEFSRAIFDLTAEIKVLNARIQSMGERQSELKKDVEELKSGPKRRMETLIGAALGAVVTGLVAFVLVRLGLK